MVAVMARSRSLLTTVALIALGCEVDRKNPGNVEYGGHDGRTMEPGRDAASPIEAGGADARAPDDGGDAGWGSPPAGIIVHEAGDTMTNASPQTRFAALLSGGGKDSVAAMTALVDAGGRGDVVILRMDDTGGAYPPYFVKRGAHGATEIVFDPVGGDNTVSSAALAALRARSDDPWIARKIDEAEVVFLAGGNQTKYVVAWRETKLAAAPPIPSRAREVETARRARRRTGSGYCGSFFFLFAEGGNGSTDTEAAATVAYPTMIPWSSRAT